MGRHLAGRRETARSRSARERRRGRHQFDSKEGPAPTGGRAYSSPSETTPMPGRGALRPAHALRAGVPQCTEPNRVHGAPLAYDSCGPPASPRATSPWVRRTRTQGRAARPLRALDGAPQQPRHTRGRGRRGARLQDVRVRNAGDLSDYAGELQARLNVRITDRRNGAPDRAGIVMVDYATLRATVPRLLLFGWPASGRVRLQPEHDARRAHAGHRPRARPRDSGSRADRGPRRGPARGRGHARQRSVRVPGHICSLRPA